MNRTLAWTRPALEDMKKLEPASARRVREAMIDLAESGHGDVVKLKSVRPSEWRSRAGDRRAFFRFRNGTNGIHVLRVRRRDKAYPGGGQPFFTLIDSRPGIDARRSSRERRVLRTRASRPQMGRQDRRRSMRAGHPHPWEAPFPGPSPL